MHNFQIFKDPPCQLYHRERLTLFLNLLLVMTIEATSITRSFLRRSTEQTDHQEIIMLTFERRVAFLHPAETKSTFQCTKNLSVLNFYKTSIKNIRL